MKQKRRKFLAVSLVSATVLLAVVMLAVFGLSRMVDEINNEMIAETPEVVLASTGVTNETGLSLPISYYDQKADPCVNMYDMSKRTELYKRQFEWTSCGYVKKTVEPGMVDYDLGEDGLPVVKSGSLTANRGLDMSRWYGAVEGMSKNYAGALRLSYVDQEMKFTYENNEFYPLDEVEFGQGEVVNADGHNHLFTMNFAIPVRILANGRERMKIMADDDTFVFVDDKLAIDLGGIHEAEIGEIEIRENGEVYASTRGEELAYSGITVTPNTDTMIKFFHADRDATESVFNLELTDMEPKVMNTKIADGGGVQVAYDPNDPSFVAPLGVSQNMRADLRQEYAVIATIYGTVIVTMSMALMMLTRYLVKRHQM